MIIEFKMPLTDVKEYLGYLEVTADVKPANTLGIEPVDLKFAFWSSYTDEVNVLPLLKAMDATGDIIDNICAAARNSYRNRETVIIGEGAESESEM